MNRMIFGDLAAAGFSADAADRYLEGLGFREPRPARENLFSLTDRLTDIALSRPELFENLFYEFSQGPDPDRALNAFERLAAIHPTPQTLFSLFESDPQSCAVVCGLCAASEHLTRLLFRRPELLNLLLDREFMTRPRNAEAMVREARSAVRSHGRYEERRDALRRFKQREILRIGALDIAGLRSLRQTTADLSDLADAALEASLEMAWEDAVRRYGAPQAEEGGPAPAFCVIGMGKLGGRELNYSSDIDVIFLCEGRGRTEGPNRVDNEFFFMKAAEKLVDAMSAATEEGYVFRVDARLRPEGTVGALVRFVDGAVNYYRSWGKVWERQALLKARPCAGDLALGERFIEGVRPFVFRALMEEADIAAIKEMRRRTEEEVVSLNDRRRELKRGYGGVRDIEFIIQFFQLMMGRDFKSLRATNSLEVIDELVEAGRLHPKEGKALRNNYVFLRTVEHRIMLFNERQTHQLPPEGPEMESLARRMGCKDAGSTSAGERFLKEYERVIEENRAIYNGVFLETGARERAGRPRAELEDLLRASPQTERSDAALRELGFRDPPRARANLCEMAGDEAGYQDAASPRSRLLAILDRLLADLSAAPEPDLALDRFERFSRAFSTRSHFFETLEMNDRLIPILTAIGGHSGYLSNILVTHPEFFEVAARADRFDGLLTADEIVKELEERFRWERSAEKKQALLGRMSRRERLRIGTRDVLGVSDIFETMNGIGALAEGTLRAALALTARGLDGGGEATDIAGFAAFAMGKLGSGELHYRSDLDVVFVCDGPLAGDKMKAGHAGETLIRIVGGHAAHGRPFEIDARLRPEGNRGPLVPALRAFEKYFQKSVEPWERLAYVRARFVAGDPGTGGELGAAIQNMTYGRGLTEEEAESLRRIKRRIETERAGPARSGQADVKVGRGGLVDIEFTVQYLQLRHGHETPSLRTPNTWKALHALREAGLVEESAFNTLREAYLFLKRVESRMQIVEDYSQKKVALEEEALQALARRMKRDGNPEEFAIRLKETMLGVRAVHEAIFYGGAD